jgi:organic hydroperoxide reductase OsmC/OhrA
LQKVFQRANSLVKSLDFQLVSFRPDGNPTAELEEVGRLMKIAARVSNTSSGHRVEVETDGREQSIGIPPKVTGRGSSINGGELLFAALATCFCNDLYREASKRNISVEDVRVEVSGTFGGPGEPARDVVYRVEV